MSVNHLVRIGLMGGVHHCQSADSRTYPRDAQVICRTDRGLETGRVLCEIDPVDEDSEANGCPAILRLVTPDDQLILQRLERYRDKAFLACQKILRGPRPDVVLVDVEHLFDGESLFFYFLGEVDAELESLTANLAAAYDKKVRFKKFAETLANGCGPDCGSKEGGCSSGGCGSCKLANACGTATK